MSSSSAIAASGATSSKPVKAVPPGGLVVVGGGGVTVVGLTVGGSVVVGGGGVVVVGGGGVVVVGGGGVVVVGGGGVVVVGGGVVVVGGGVVVVGGGVVVVGGFFELVNVHFTSSPAITLNVAVVPDPEPALSSHVMLTRVQPAGTISETEYVPGSTVLVEPSPSLSNTLKAPVNWNSVGSPLGIVTFSMEMRAWGSSPEYAELGKIAQAIIRSVAAVTAMRPSCVRRDLVGVALRCDLPIRTSL